MPKDSLSSQVLSPRLLSEKQRREMFQVFSQYYEGHSFEQFMKDLLEKDDVILLLEKSTGQIQGFSTLLKIKLQVGDKQIWAVYSGDTVLNRKHWGSKALGVTFLMYLFRLKLKNPFQEVYWFLISKGYKTYLIMANNFKTHFPRLEFSTPRFEKELMDDFYSKKFGSLYDSTSGLIQPHGPSCHLKVDVADIDRELLKNPRIAYFQKMNPDWQKGTELCCIARMSLLMPFYYIMKKVFKTKRLKTDGK
ncbi:MAG: hypothetical protein ACK5W9_12160 [Bdellovibrionales bacterium]